MKQFIYNPIWDDIYIGIITILDYEIPTHECLSHISLSIKGNSTKKVIVDLALKVGLTKYRFVSYDISENGEILTDTFIYIYPEEKIIKIANAFICENKDLFTYSVLSDKSLRKLITE